jgi:outer membrane protein TolC
MYSATRHRLLESILAGLSLIWLSSAADLATAGPGDEAPPESFPVLRATPVAPPDPSAPFTDGPPGLPEEDRQSALAAHGFDRKREWTLPQLVDEALRRNPSTKAAWYNARASIANAKVAESAYYPQATVTASVTPSDIQSPNYQGASDEVEQVQFAPGISIDYLLLDFGTRDAEVQAARYGALATNYYINANLQTIVFNVMTNYYGVDAAKANLAYQESSLKVAEMTFKSTEIKKRSGLATSTDLYQAQQSVAQNQYNVVSAKGVVEQTQVQLAASIGLPANVPVRAARPQSPPPLKILQTKVDILVDRALRQRPDLAQQYALWRVAQAQANAADAAIWPTITTSLSVTRTFFDARDTESGTVTKSSGHFDDIQGQLTFSFDVFDGGERLFTARQARELAKNAEANLADAELTAIAEVVVAFVAFQSAAQQVTAGEALVTSSRISLDSTQISYQNGLSTILDLLTAQTNLATAESTLATARQDLFTAAAELGAATGALVPPQAGTTGRSWQNELGPKR